jgi:hypothetical protein
MGDDRKLPLFGWYRQFDELPHPRQLADERRKHEDERLRKAEGGKNKQEPEWYEATRRLWALKYPKHSASCIETMLRKAKSQDSPNARQFCAFFIRCQNST